MKVYIVSVTNIEKEECYYIPETEICKVFMNEVKAKDYVQKELIKVINEHSSDPSIKIGDGYVEFDYGWQEVSFDINEFEVED